MKTPASFWRLTDQATYSRDTLAALSALTIGALGNLPVQDLMHASYRRDQRLQLAGRASLALSAIWRWV